MGLPGPRAALRGHRVQRRRGRGAARVGGSLRQGGPDASLRCDRRGWNLLVQQRRGRDHHAAGLRPHRRPGRYPQQANANVQLIQIRGWLDTDGNGAPTPRTRPRRGRNWSSTPPAQAAVTAPAATWSAGTSHTRRAGHSDLHLAGRPAPGPDHPDQTRRVLAAADPRGGHQGTTVIVTLPTESGGESE